MKSFISIGLILSLFLPQYAIAAETNLAKNLSGKILLQVEQNGEAWYVNPDNLQRYFLGRPIDAFALMRDLGLGISNNDLQKIPEINGGGGDIAFTQKLSGKILLQVEENGEAWYVNPTDQKRYFLGRPADAFSVMRSTGLGVNDIDLSQISISPESAIVPVSQDIVQDNTDTNSQDSINNDVSDNSNLDNTVQVLETTAKYKIEFIATWSQETHPNNYVSSAHFSPFIAYSHNNQIDSKIFERGTVSTEGMEIMAETGGTVKLTEEIDSIIAKQFAYKQTKGTVFDSPGSVSAELEFSSNHQYFTFVSMVAPSPDWFVSKTAQLVKDGEWVDSIEFDLITYDAGTDSGEELISSDLDTNPKEEVTLFPDNLQNLGKLKITKIN